MARGGPAITEATHTVWWIVAGLGLVIFALGLHPAPVRHRGRFAL
jgi:hypothetical protein